MRCLALFTGGLDSQLAVRLVQRQGIEVVGVHVSTPFTAAPAAAIAAAERLQIELRTIEWQHDYLRLLQRPKFGFAAELAPCLDCRIGMVARAQALLEPLGASFLISGEVVGQRPSSLRSRNLETIAMHGKADDLLLRPLSAQLLPPTLPERNGWVDRAQLLGWHGRGRKDQLALAHEWNLVEPVGHAPGCRLLEATYAGRLKQLLAVQNSPPLWQLTALQLGRHFSWHGAHAIVARNQAEGEQLWEVFLAGDRESNTTAIWLAPRNFRGPVALLFGSIDDLALQRTAATIRSFSKDVVTGESQLMLSGARTGPLAMPASLRANH